MLKASKITTIPFDHLENYRHLPLFHSEAMAIEFARSLNRRIFHELTNDGTLFNNPSVTLPGNGKFMVIPGQATRTQLETELAVFKPKNSTHEKITRFNPDEYTLLRSGQTSYVLPTPKLALDFANFVIRSAFSDHYALTANIEGRKITFRGALPAMVDNIAGDLSNWGASRYQEKADVQKTDVLIGSVEIIDFIDYAPHVPEDTGDITYVFPYTEDRYQKLSDYCSTADIRTKMAINPTTLKHELQFFCSKDEKDFLEAESRVQQIIGVVNNAYAADDDYKTAITFIPAQATLIYSLLTQELASEFAIVANEIAKSKKLNMTAEADLNTVHVTGNISRIRQIISDHDSKLECSFALRTPELERTPIQRKLADITADLISMKSGYVESVAAHAASSGYITIT